MHKAIIAVLTSVMLTAAPRDSSAGGADPVTGWAVERMASWSAPGKYGWLGETPEEARSRYAEIARAARDVAFDPKEEPVFPGPDGRSRTMAVLLAIASVESGGFQKKVDLGVGDGVGDGGKSWCLMQVRLSQLGPGKKTWYRVVLDGKYWSYAYDAASGWGGEDLVADRAKCFRAGLHIVRKSFDSMAYAPLEDRLAAYASGKTTVGLTASRRRMGKAVDWLKAAPPPVPDAEVMKGLSAVLDVAS